MKPQTLLPVAIFWIAGPVLPVVAHARIAAPMVGEMISSTILTPAVIPAIYALVKEWPLRRQTAKPARETATAAVASQIAPM